MGTDVLGCSSFNDSRYFSPKWLRMFVLALVQYCFADIIIRQVMMLQIGTK